MSFSTKLFFGLLFVFTALLFTLPTSAESESYQIDSSHSCVNFKIKHLKVSYFFGRFNQVSGQFLFDSADPSKSSLNLEIKADSIDTNNANRDNHLKSPDFFNTKQFPTLTFKSQKFEAIQKNRYRLTGELTVHCVTKVITTEVEHTGSEKALDKFGYRAGFLTTFTILRSEFGMKYMEGLLGDEVELTVSLEGIRQ